VDAARHQHDEHPVAARDGSLDDFPIVGPTRNDLDELVEPTELLDALLPTHADDVVTAVERVLDHVLPELPGRADDADALLARAHGPRLDRIARA
jgi:hypothetical protein